MFKNFDWSKISWKKVGIVLLIVLAARWAFGGSSHKPEDGFYDSGEPNFTYVLRVYNDGHTVDILKNYVEHKFHVDYDVDGHPVVANTDNIFENLLYVDWTVKGDTIILHKITDSITGKFVNFRDTAFRRTENKAFNKNFLGK